MSLGATSKSVCNSKSALSLIKYFNTESSLERKNKIVKYLPVLSSSRNSNIDNSNFLSLPLGSRKDGFTQADDSNQYTESFYNLKTPRQLTQHFDFQERRFL